MSSTALTTPPPPRVLLVDDQPDILELLVLLLDVEGFTIVTAASGEEALAEARRSTFDGIVLDVSMPEMDGIELAHALRNLPATREVPIVFHTSLMESEVRARFVDYQGFLRKPVDPEKFVSTLHRVVAPASLGAGAMSHEVSGP